MDWRKDFDKKFEEPEGAFGWSYFPKEQVISFIENLLEQERKVVHFETTIDTRGIEERAKEEERKRILSLPCMEREEAPEEVHDLDNQLELIQGLANFNWNSGRNFLRRELKEAIINKK